MADLSIMVPIDGLRRLHSSPEIGSILARADPAADLAVTAHDLQQYLQDRLGGRPVDVQIPRQLLDGLKHQADTFRTCSPDWAASPCWWAVWES